MDKIIHVKTNEEMYYKLIELKGKLKAKDWNDFLKKIIEKLEADKCLKSS